MDDWKPRVPLEHARYRMAMLFLAPIYAQMGRLGVTFADMAARLDRDPEHLADALRPPRDMGDVKALTLGIIAEAALALGCDVEFRTQEIPREMIPEDIGCKYAEAA